MNKRRHGKKLKDLTTDDWTEIAGDTAVGAARGGVRGLSIYSLINLTVTSVAVANMMAAAAFGVADQANKFRRGEISEVTFVENAELVCLEVGVCALSSALGQAIIPVPILGAVIGNTVGTIMYNAASSSLSARETALVNSYLDDQRTLDEKLALEHDALIGKLESSMSSYVTALDRAFSPDIEVALLGSIELAREVGVSSTDILDTDEKVHEYFLD
jgi:ABC-type iron transport system FetAB permease component